MPIGPHGLSESSVKQQRCAEWFFIFSSVSVVHTHLYFTINGSTKFAFAKNAVSAWFGSELENLFSEQSFGLLCTNK